MMKRKCSQLNREGKGAGIELAGFSLALTHEDSISMALPSTFRAPLIGRQTNSAKSDREAMKRNANLRRKWRKMRRRINTEKGSGPIASTAQTAEAVTFFISAQIVAEDGIFFARQLMR
jgi:hypothetical protein